jgi:hypothetical protein
MTVADSKETFFVPADALVGNGWVPPAAPGGASSSTKLWVTGERNGGLLLHDSELGQEYWVSNTGLITSGFTRRVNQ